MNNLAHKMTNQLELDVREFGRQLYNERLAYLFKVPEEMQQTPVDFFGWTPSGRAIAIECKQVKRRSLPIGDGTNGLQGHQWNALELASRCGALSLLIWRNGQETRALHFWQLVTLSQGRRSIEWPLTEVLGWQDIIRAAIQPPTG